MDTYFRKVGGYRRSNLFPNKPQDINLSVFTFPVLV